MSRAHPARVLARVSRGRVRDASARGLPARYPNTARVFTGDFVGMADLPYDFFMSRYIAAYEATSTPLASRARAARARR